MVSFECTSSVFGGASCSNDKFPCSEAGVGCVWTDGDCTAVFDDVNRGSKATCSVKCEVSIASIE